MKVEVTLLLYLKKSFSNIKVTAQNNKVIVLNFHLTVNSAQLLGGGIDSFLSSAFIISIYSSRSLVTTTFGTRPKNPNYSPRFAATNKQRHITTSPTNNCRRPGDRSHHGCNSRRHETLPPRTYSSNPKTTRLFDVRLILRR